MYMSLTSTLTEIGADILHHLSLSKEPLTQRQLFERSEIGVFKTGAGYSELGWAHALDKLERKHLVEFVNDRYWKLKEPERAHYMKEVESVTLKKVFPD
jgi:hypothetical protein